MSNLVFIIINADKYGETKRNETKPFDASKMSIMRMGRKQTRTRHTPELARYK